MKFCRECDYRKDNICPFTNKYIYEISNKDCPLRYNLEELSEMEDNVHRYERLLARLERVVRKVLGSRYHISSYSYACMDIIEEYEKTKRSRDMWKGISWIMMIILVAIVFFTQKN